MIITIISIEANIIDMSFPSKRDFMIKSWIVKYKVENQYPEVISSRFTGIIEFRKLPDIKDIISIIEREHEYSTAPQQT